jgi:hypothetical protein
MALKDDPKCGCGISWLWMTSESDPLRGACATHDNLYAHKNMLGLTRKEADRRFLKEALKIAKSRESLREKGKAYLYYGIIRTTGWLWW